MSDNASALPKPSPPRAGRNPLDSFGSPLGFSLSLSLFWGVGSGVVGWLPIIGDQGVPGDGLTWGLGCLLAVVLLWYWVELRHVYSVTAVLGLLTLAVLLMLVTLALLAAEFSLHWLIVGLIFGLFGGLFGGVLGALVNGLVGGLTFGAFIGLSIGLTVGFFGGLINGLAVAASGGLVSGLIAGLFGGMLGGTLGALRQLLWPITRSLY